MADSSAWNPFQVPGSCAGEVAKPTPTPTQIGRFWGVLFGAYFLGRLGVLVLQGIMLGHFSKAFPYLAASAVSYFFLVAFIGWLGPRLGLLGTLVEVPCFALVAAAAIGALWFITLLIMVSVAGVGPFSQTAELVFKTLPPHLIRPFLDLLAYLSAMSLVIWWRLRVHRRRASA